MQDHCFCYGTSRITSRRPRCPGRSPYRRDISRQCHRNSEPRIYQRQAPGAGHLAISPHMVPRYTELLARSTSDKIGITEKSPVQHRALSIIHQHSSLMRPPDRLVLRVVAQFLDPAAPSCIFPVVRVLLRRIAFLLRSASNNRDRLSTAAE